MMAAPGVGFRKTSLVDYPGLVSSVLFSPGCNYRCPWCHNPELVLQSKIAKEEFLPLKSCMDEISRRSHLIQGVVLTGGEALLSPWLADTIRALHGLGLSVKLDTNGSLPDRLAYLLENANTRPDFVSLDLKTGSVAYKNLAASGTFFSHDSPFDAVVDSLHLLIASNIEFELRTVVVPGFFDQKILGELAKAVPSDVPWHFSPFIPGNCLDPAFNEIAMPRALEIEDYVRMATRLGKNAKIR
jgi:pyruvate formate lyase activating enzyme